MRKKGQSKTRIMMRSRLDPIPNSVIEGDPFPERFKFNPISGHDLFVGTFVLCLPRSA
ncbi:hypothetical protein BYT27DRAFT_7343442 [Phlegmacium glaucopus]|nr:hypothetical protein BYT27DRAFT_7343442 [Phlegmacium glaucopus]